MNVSVAREYVRPAVRQVGRLFRDPMTAAGVGILAIIVLVALLGPLFVKNDPLTANMAERLLPPGAQYPLGTDHLGRCLFSRLVMGAETTLGISALVIAIVMLIGMAVGLISGYLGGRVDAFLMRTVDGMSVLPDFMLVIAISGFLGPSLNNLMLSLVLINWIGYARMVREIVLSEREKEYVLAARVAGCGTWVE